MDLKKIEKIFPMNIEKYERFIPDISEGDIISKMNDVVQYLNRIGHISSDVVGNWNIVMKWVLNDGLTEETTKKINEMVDSGAFDQIINESQAGWKAEVDSELEDVNNQLEDLAVNVKSFGAKGDGVTNDSQSFQAANDFLKSKGGGILLVPSGTFIANFILDSNITLKGNGVNSTIIKSAPNSNLDVIKGRDFDLYTGTTADVSTQGLRFISIQDITIDGNKHNNASGYGIRIWGCFWYFNNVVVQYCKNDGIWTEFTSILSPTENTARTAALESMFRNIKILYCDGNAWTYNGPHDSIIDNYVAIGNLGWALYQRNFNSFLTGENWNVWKNGNGFYVGTGIAGHSLIADNDGTGIGMEFHPNSGNSRIVNSRLSGWDKGLIVKGQSHNIKMNIQNCGLYSDGSAIVVEGLSLTHLECIVISSNCVLDVISEISKNSFIITSSVPSGRTFQRGVNIRSDSFALLNSGGTGMMQLAENSLKVKGWTFTFPQNNGEIITSQSVPTTTKRGAVLKQPTIADLTAAPTASDFNDLLTKLRNAGILT